MEPADSMYPQDTTKVHFERSNNYWQANHMYGTQIFVTASNAEEAETRIKEIFLALNLDVSPGSFQFRRLLLAILKKA